MVPSRRAISFLTALVLALSPASALAQGAGDDQYEDPFGDEVPQTATPTPTPTPTPASSDPSTVTGEMPGGESEAADDQTPDSSAAAAQRSQLPATGGDALIVGLVGVAFVMGGAGLRLRLRDGLPAG